MHKMSTQHPRRRMGTGRSVAGPDLRLSVTAFAVFVAALGAATNVRAAQPIGCLIEPRQVVELGSPVIGVIDQVMVERGDTVRKGQVVATLKADVERAAAGVAQSKAQAEADLHAAIANRDYNKQRLARAEDLLKKSFISPQALDQAKTEYDVAEQKLAQAREQKRIWDREHDMARAQLSLRSLISPLNGVVVDRYLSPGERIEDKPAMKLADTNPLRVEVFMPSASYNDIKPGMAARVYPELPNAGEHLAKVVLVDRIVDPASNTFRVRLELPNPDNALPAGLRCKVALGDKVIGGPQDPLKNLKPVGSAAAISGTSGPAIGITTPAAAPVPVAAPNSAANPASVAKPAVALSAPPAAQVAGLVPAPVAKPAAPSPEDSLLAAIETWRQAWAKQDVPGYLAAYVPEFKGKAPSHPAWAKEREERITNAKDLEIRLADVKVVKLSDGRAGVRFTQHYRSADHSDQARKMLVLALRDGKWLIQAERIE
jgi:membrane fusion protein, heavy metal efflux system